MTDFEELNLGDDGPDLTDEETGDLIGPFCHLGVGPKGRCPQSKMCMAWDEENQGCLDIFEKQERASFFATVRDEIGSLRGVLPLLLGGEAGEEEAQEEEAPPKESELGTVVLESN